MRMLFVAYSRYTCGYDDDIIFNTNSRGDLHLHAKLTCLPCIIAELQQKVVFFLFSN